MFNDPLGLAAKKGDGNGGETDPPEDKKFETLKTTTPEAGGEIVTEDGVVKSTDWKETSAGRSRSITIEPVAETQVSTSENSKPTIEESLGPVISKYDIKSQNLIIETVTENKLDINHIKVIENKDGLPKKIKYTGPKRQIKGGIGWHWGVWDGGVEEGIIYGGGDVAIAIELGNTDRTILGMQRKSYWTMPKSWRMKHRQTIKRDKYNTNHDLVYGQEGYKPVFGKNKNYINFAYDGYHRKYSRRKKQKAKYEKLKNIRARRNRQKENYTK